MEKNSNIIIQPLRSPFPQHYGYIWPAKFWAFSYPKGKLSLVQWLWDFSVYAENQGVVPVTQLAREVENLCFSIRQLHKSPQTPVPVTAAVIQAQSIQKLWEKFFRAALPWMSYCWAALLWQFTCPISCHPSAFLSLFFWGADLLQFIPWPVQSVSEEMVCMSEHRIFLSEDRSREVKRDFGISKVTVAHLETDSWPQTSTDLSKRRGIPKVRWWYQ